METGRKKKFAPAQGGMGHGPGRGRFMEKPKLKNAKGTLLRLLGYLKYVRVPMICALVALILASVANLTAPRVAGRIIDAIVGKDTSALGRYVLMLLGIYVISTVFSWAQSILLTDVSNKSVRMIRKDLFDHVQTLPLKFFDSRPHGELMSRLTNDVDNVSNMLSSTLTQVFSSVITFVMCLYFMLSMSWRMTLVSFVVIPLSMLVVRAITKRTGKMFKAQQAALGEINGIVEENVTGAKVVKVFCREEAVIEEFEEANAEYAQVGARANIFSSSMGPIMNFFGNLTFALVAGVGGYLVSGGIMSVGVIQSFLQYARTFAQPFNQIAQQITMVQSALAGAERVFEIMDTPGEAPDAPDASALPDPKGHVVFDDVSFGYNEDRMILKDISFEALSGKTIALVGPTGAGKTTVVNLLMRFYDANKGQIHVDGHPIASIQRQRLRDTMGMVLQDVYLFTGTVRDNIAYGKLDATDEEIERAAHIANCHEFISRLPQGYDTVLSEDGGSLSQGQRQLLSIARAVLANPSVLILDEATSSVDTRTEMHIQQAMLNLMKGRTSFVIAHRLSTIRGADMILVIDDGRIIERGTHEELLKQDGFYAKMLSSQFRTISLTA